MVAWLMTPEGELDLIFDSVCSTVDVKYSSGWSRDIEYVFAVGRHL